MAEGLDPVEFLRLSREKSRPGRRRRRRKQERRRLGLVASEASQGSGYGGKKARRKEVLEVSNIFIFYSLSCYKDTAKGLWVL